jgi:hypothetical protein
LKPHLTIILLLLNMIHHTIRIVIISKLYFFKRLIFSVYAETCPNNNVATECMSFQCSVGYYKECVNQICTCNSKFIFNHLQCIFCKKITFVTKLNWSTTHWYIVLFCVWSISLAQILWYVEARFWPRPKYLKFCFCTSKYFDSLHTCRNRKGLVFATSIVPD